MSYKFFHVQEETKLFFFLIKYTEIFTKCKNSRVIKKANFILICYIQNI
jgi:hypothetical protein